MAITSASSLDYSVFLATYGYTASPNDAASLALAFAFMGTLPFCDGADTVQTPAMTQAQLFIAYAISSGAFNPSAVVSSTVLIEEDIGRSALVEKYAVVNDALTGSDPMSLLQSMPMAYGLLSGSLCPTPDATTCGTGIGVFVV